MTKAVKLALKASKSEKKVSKKVGGSSFTVRGVQITEALNQIKKVTGNATELVYVSYREGKLFIRSLNKDMKVQITVPCEGGSKEDDFGINMAVFAGICAKRAEIDFTRKNESAFEYKAQKGSYSGTFVCTPYQEITIVDSDTKGKALKADMQEQLLKWLPQMVVNAEFTEETMAVQIKADKQGLRMSCADSYHGTTYHYKKKVGDLEINIPTQHIPLLISFIDPKDKGSLASSDNSLIFWNSTVQISFPLVATDKELDLTFQNAKIKGDFGSFDVNKIPDLLDNLNSFYEDKSTIACRSTGKTLEFELKTGYGSAKDTIQLIEPLPKCEFRLEPAIFKALIDKMTGTTKFGLASMKKDGKTVYGQLSMVNPVKNGKFTTFCILVLN